MARFISLHVLLNVMLLILCPEAESQWVPRRPLPPVHPPPLCASQFALANRACGMLPFTHIPPPSPPSPTPVPPSPDEPGDDHGHNDDGDNNDGNNDDDNKHHDHNRNHHYRHHGDGNNNNHTHHHHNHTHHHHNLHPDNDEDDDNHHHDHRHNNDHSHGHKQGDSHGHNHGHRHRHGGRHSRHENKGTPVEKDCCRWLKEVDNMCVCEMLVRLPRYLTRPVHHYTVIVGSTCEVTFQCGSRWVKA